MQDRLKGLDDMEEKKVRIITYGLRYPDFETQRELFALRNNGDIEIVAEIGYDSENPEIFGKRMTLEAGLGCGYDCVVLCGGDVADLNKLEVTRLLEMSDLTVPHYEKIKHTQLSILQELVEAPDEKIKDRSWLRDRIFAYGFFPFFKLAKEPQDGVTWSTRGILQVPDEFLDFCKVLTEMKAENAIEIGVARGASSYVIAALLYRNNPELVYHMADICDDLNDFEKVQSVIPALRKDIPNTSDDFVGQEFDFCFIDADHSYDGMIRDWENVGRYTKKMLVFHDIFGHEYDELNGGTVRGWQEIKNKVSEKHVREISEYPDRWMGLGLIYL